MPIAVKARRIRLAPVRDPYRRREVVAASNDHREGQKGDKKQVEEQRPSVSAARRFRFLLSARACEPKSCERREEAGDDVGDQRAAQAEKSGNQLRSG